MSVTQEEIEAQIRDQRDSQAQKRILLFGIVAAGIPLMTIITIILLMVFGPLITSVLEGLV